MKATIYFLDKLLNEAVKNQIISDVLVGCFLSGGVDSLVASYMQSNLKKLILFQLALKNKQYDESSLYKFFYIDRLMDYKK